MKVSKFAGHVLTPKVHKESRGYFNESFSAIHELVLRGSFAKDCSMMEDLVGEHVEYPRNLVSRQRSHRLVCYFKLGVVSSHDDHVYVRNHLLHLGKP